jgi:signal transduction histidine kinase
MVPPMSAGFVLIIGLAATTATAGALNAQQDSTGAWVMDQRTEMAGQAVVTESERYRALLETAAAGLATRDAMNRTDFDAVTKPLASAGLNGVAGVTFVIPGIVAQIPATQRLWRGRGATDLHLLALPGRGEQFFPIFSRSLNGGPEHILPNLSAVPESEAPLQDSRRLGLSTVSDPYVLLADRALPNSEQQLAFTFVAPIRQPTGDHQFRGWLVLNMRGQDFLGEVLATVSQGQLDAQLFASTTTGSLIAVATYTGLGTPDLERSADIPVANQKWTLITRADTEHLPGADTLLPAVVQIGGGILSLVLAGLVYVLAAGRMRARRAAAEVRRAEAESRRQAGLLTAVMTSLCDGVGVVDENGRFLLHNPAAQDLFGVRGDAGGPDDWQRHFGLFEPDGRTPFPIDEMPLIRALEGEASDGVEMVVRNPVHADGILISVSGRPLDPGAGQRGAVAVFHDITELRQYETDLAVFAGVVAHDLKAPLTVIGGHCEIAGYALADNDPEEARTALTGISRAVFRMAGLIDTLLAYTTARDATLNTGPVDLNVLVADVAQDRISHLTEAERPELHLAPLPTVRADPAMLRHVLDNLIGNALKYVEPDTTPRIEVRSGAAPDGWARIEVADRGIGIPDEHKPAVFERFHRAHLNSGYAGTGLGLAICKRIVERHGGKIAVADNPGGGTCFHFTLPLATLLPDEHETTTRARLDLALTERATVDHE